MSDFTSLITAAITIKELATSDSQLAIEKFLEWKEQVKLETDTLSIYPRICAALMIQGNTFSQQPDITSVISSIDKVLLLLNRISTLETAANELTEQSALIVVRRILRNFHKHLEEMYQKHVHGKGTLKQTDLDKITLGNEYDVQRMLSSLLKPIFPTARVEVFGDGGYTGTRYDIFISEYNLVIEVKCTRTSMTERHLTEEIGSDICHYTSHHLMFFIFDKQKIISNPDAFEARYTKSFDGKDVETYVVQPIII